jgi:hypothetical protein
MARIRQVLRNEYIGAIAIGFLLAQSVGVLVSIILRPIEFYLTGGGRQHSVFGFTESAQYPWSQLFVPVLTLILYWMVAVLLLYWLYWRGASSETQVEQSTAAADLFE